jgi:quercetin dioxygenase-like cupin family protein
MPAIASAASTDATVVAPDGVAIHSIATPTAACVGVAEGRIPLGRYGVHRHLSLEQVTYVIAGTVTAITDGVATELAPGELLLTLPGGLQPHP